MKLYESIERQMFRQHNEADKNESVVTPIIGVHFHIAIFVYIGPINVLTDDSIKRSSNCILTDTESIGALSGFRYCIVPEPTESTDALPSTAAVCVDDVTVDDVAGESVSLAGDPFLASSEEDIAQSLLVDDVTSDGRISVKLEKLGKLCWTNDQT